MIGPLNTVPKPPANLPKSAHELWTSTAQYLVNRGLLHSADLITLRTYCMTVYRYGLLSRELDDAVLIGDDTAIIRLATVLNTTGGQIRMFANSLHLTPNSRNRATAAVRGGEAVDHENEDEQQWQNVLNQAKSGRSRSRTPKGPAH